MLFMFIKRDQVINIRHFFTNMETFNQTLPFLSCYAWLNWIERDELWHCCEYVNVTEGMCVIMHLGGDFFGVPLLNVHAQCEREKNTRKG